ncbi:jg8334 [Pararge aegeria aegeria]|uniref:Jg8334 protein n=1 Tax=Pararge aegeria aegeria TaxID=348720 RepID=A0A8S4SLH4_9NEOP|nr:jg8334 [Pararge aegeria aegeria]
MGMAVVLDSDPQGRSVEVKPQGLVTGLFAASAVDENQTMNSYTPETGQISLALTVKENIVWKPACLRVLQSVLKGVWSPPIRTGVAWWITA